jgi:alpha-mannosidase
VSSVVEVRAGERLVRVESTVDNRRRDHRLRAHLPLAAPATRSRAECAFAVVERGLEAEGGPTEAGVPTFPSRRFVQAGGLTVVHEGLLEYELVDVGAAGATQLALTLLRCTGLLSAGPMATRPLPAGPIVGLEGPQLQRRLTLRWGWAVGGDLDPYALVDDAFVPLRAVPGGAGLGGARPPAGSALTVDGAEVSAVRRTPAGQLEIRLFNPTDAATVAQLPGRRGWVVDLLGRPIEAWEGTVALAPWRIATLQLDDAAG